MQSENDIESDDLWTTEQVAEWLKIKPRTVTLMRNEGKLQFVRLGPKLVRFRPADLRAYAEEHLQRAESAAA
jgi:excisionase family DNA binding protein